MSNLDTPNKEDKPYNILSDFKKDKPLTLKDLVQKNLSPEAEIAIKRALQEAHNDQVKGNESVRFKEDELLNVELTYDQFSDFLASSWLEAEETTEEYPSRKFRRNVFTRLENKVKHKGARQTAHPLKEDLKVVGEEDEELREKLAMYVAGLAESGDNFMKPEMVSQEVRTSYVDSLFRLIKSRDQRIALAYGGCTNCYGKGYATYSGEYSAQDMKWPDKPIKYCDCERGKQLEKVDERIALEAQQRTDELLDALSSMYEQYCGDKHGHLFMSAGEGASELLERYGRYKFDGAGRIIATLKQSQKEE